MSSVLPGRTPVNLKEVVLDSITAAIFDMDDLMINSHPIHMKVFKEVLGSYGVSLDDPENPWTPEDEASMFGLTIANAFELFISKYHLHDQADPNIMSRKFSDKIIPTFQSENLKPMPGLERLLGALKEHDISLALASSAKKIKIDVVLGKLGLSDSFEVIVSGEDEINRGKPAPDIFLEAARKLKCEPFQCMVFEDAKNGIEAAKAAGMFAIGVHNQFSEHRLGIRQDLSAADLQVYSLSELTYG